MADWGTVPQWVSALTGLAALCVGWRAAAAWRRTLAAKRGDDVLVASYDVAAAIGKLRSALDRRVDRPEFGQHVDKLYANLLELQKAYAVAKLSYPSKFSNAEVEEVIDGAVKLHEQARSAYLSQQGFDEALSAEIDRFGREAQKNAEDLRLMLNNALGSGSRYWW